jgi:hypothetical protein
VKVPTSPNVPIVAKEIFVWVDKDPFSVQFLRNRKHTVIQCVQKTGASETETEGYFNRDTSLVSFIWNEGPRQPSPNQQGVGEQTV